jgi:hypothetical protein
MQSGGEQAMNHAWYLEGLTSGTCDRCHGALATVRLLGPGGREHGRYCVSCGCSEMNARNAGGRSAVGGVNRGVR